METWNQRSEIVTHDLPTGKQNFLNSAVSDAWGPRLATSAKEGEAANFKGKEPGSDCKPATPEQKKQEISLLEQASASYMKGDLPAAEETWKKVLTLQKSMYGEKSPPVADTLMNIGNACNAQQNFTAGEMYTRQAVDAFKTQGTAGEIGLAASLGNLAESQIGQNQPVKADASYQMCLKVLDKNLPTCTKANDLLDNRRLTHNILKDYAKFLDSTGDTTKADEIRQRAQAVEGELQKIQPPKHEQND